ncbi:fungal pheromone STE3G-protein-coupled receptor [Roridomyces roridus]|uniref:Fungal pheromone STE3G-protein-coupled receptor n=1 Tax=Roridomyces roridus TaxID=1738132 RepID=A0AAD7CD05_9AGAR|nr:fungal pheromone STE3G-protein-coupled receptor [Roridomyces roridus]KAJ7644995.1 fungal pheromone STE3G-protein-coupled receptor [Roridomyces roridus]
MPSSALVAVPFVASFLILVTVPHHWRVRNCATLSLIAWLLAFDLVHGVDAAIWSGNVDIVAPVWCDIATKIILGAKTSVTGCSLCLAMQLHRIANCAVRPRGWRDRVAELGLCWGFAFVIMGLHYIVQGHRFDIIQDLGCWPAIYVSWPSILILTAPQLGAAVLALVYSTLAFVEIYRRRRTFRTVMEKCGTGAGRAITPAQYFRLLLTVVFVGSYVVFNSVSASTAFADGLQPWTNWTDVHSRFSFIGQYTPEDPDPNLGDIYAFWLALPLTGLLFFVIFGIGAEANREYGDIWKAVACLFSRKTGGTGGVEVEDSPYKLPPLEQLPALTWEV